MADHSARKRKLKLWNGRYMQPGYQAHVFVAAHSREDVRKLFTELGLHRPSISEIAVYWSAGCWGNSMNDVTPERGVWITPSNRYGDKPVRQLPKSQSLAAMAGKGR